MDQTDFEDGAEDEAREMIKKLFEQTYPDMKVEFAEDFVSEMNHEDWKEINDGLDTMINRQNSKLLGWFWKWFYRPRRL